MIDFFAAAMTRRATRTEVSVTSVDASFIGRKRFVVVVFVVVMAIVTEQPFVTPMIGIAVRCDERIKGLLLLLGLDLLGWLLLWLVCWWDDDGGNARRGRGLAVEQVGRVVDGRFEGGILDKTVGRMVAPGCTNFTGIVRVLIASVVRSRTNVIALRRCHWRLASEGCVRSLRRRVTGGSYTKILSGEPGDGSGRKRRRISGRGWGAVVGPAEGIVQTRGGGAQEARRVAKVVVTRGQ